MLERLRTIFLRIKHNQGFQRYSRNTLWMLSDQVLRLVAGLVVGIWVARYLGPTQFGVMNYVVAFVAIFGVLAKVGLDNILVRDLVDRPEQSDVYLGTAFWLKITASLLTVLLIAGYVVFSNEDNEIKAFMLILATSVIFQAFEVVDFYFQAKVASKFSSICKTVQLLISSAVKIYLIYIKADLIFFIIVLVADQVTLAATQATVYRIVAGNVRFLGRFSTSAASQLLRNSWPLIFGSIFIMIYMRIDQIMIMRMLGELENGLFSAAVRISEAWYFVPVIITNSLLPAVINAKKTSNELYYARLQRFFDFMLIVGILFAVFVTCFSHLIVTLLFGNEYAAAAGALTIHCWAGVFVSLGVSTGNWVISENLQHLTLWKTVAGSVLNIGLNFMLIPLWGIEGAAIATLVSQACVYFLFNAFHRRLFTIFSMQVKSLYLPGSLKRLLTHKSFK